MIHLMLPTTFINMEQSCNLFISAGEKEISMMSFSKNNEAKRKLSGDGDNIIIFFVDYQEYVDIIGRAELSESIKFSIRNRLVVK